MGVYDAPVGHHHDATGELAPVPWGPAADVPIVMAPAGAVHMSILDLATWAAWNAGGGRRSPPLVSEETLGRLQTAHVAGDPPAPTGYGLGWGVTTFDWTAHPVLHHAGSNDLNYAFILVDPVNDLAIVVATNFPIGNSRPAVEEIRRHLYLAYVAD